MLDGWIDIIQGFDVQASINLTERIDAAEDIDPEDDDETRSAALVDVLVDLIQSTTPDERNNDDWVVVIGHFVDLFNELDCELDTDLLSTVNARIQEITTAEERAQDASLRYAEEYYSSEDTASDDDGAAE